MIFAVKDHVEQVKAGTKTETRRKATALVRYKVGKTYAIQPKRTAKGIPEGRILITAIWTEPNGIPISAESAKAEGGYSPQEYEKLYNRMHPHWLVRAALRFKFVPNCFADKVSEVKP